MATQRKRKSGVWEFFDEPTECRAEEKSSRNRKIPCKLCDIELSDGGGTSNLMNHLQAKHPQEYKRLVNNSEWIKSKAKQTTLSDGAM